jgi:hypothetical protein
MPDAALILDACLKQRKLRHGVSSLEVFVHITGKELKLNMMNY